MDTGLVLSGGGFRGIAHVGVIKALEEFGIVPTHIAGTSSGAIVGALYAADLSYQEIMEFLKQVNIFSIYKYARSKPGFVDSEKFYEEFSKILPGDNFSTLKIPLIITATDVLDGTLKTFEDGQLIRPILASAAFPGVFTPVKIENSHYIDGGTLNNFPVDLIRHKCERLFGVYVNPFRRIGIDELKHSYNVLERAYQIRSANSSVSKFRDCDVLIIPKNMHKYGTFSIKDMNTIFELGYQGALEALKTYNSNDTEKIKISD
ncbi:MAG: patatin-like phospholipase family protein [Flavobacteriaceae bacterium]